jgi:transposase
MMGRLNHNQRQFFYSFCLDEAVPGDHLVRQIAAVLDLSWVHRELAPFYPKLGRPSIDPELMIRMLIIGYVFAIRSERALCRDVHVTWPIAGSVGSQSRTRSQTIRRSRAPVMSGSVTATCFAEYSSVLLRAVLRPGLSVAKGLQLMRA